MLATTLVGCSTDDALMTIDSDYTQEENTTFSVNLNLGIPDPIQVSSRSGSNGIENITVLCFNENHKLVSIAAYDETTGLKLDNNNSTLTAEVTYTTRVIHLIANKTISGITPSEFMEGDVAQLVSEGTEMVYWTRIEIPAEKQKSTDIADWFNSTFHEQNPILLLRNQAKVSVESAKDDNGNPFFIVEEFYVYNTWNKGTVASCYYDEEGKPHFPTVDVNNNWANDKYLHVPDSETPELVKITTSDRTASDGINPLYVYETEYSKNTYIILKGYNSDDPNNKKYWRVSFTADNKSLSIRRNHHYVVNINGFISLTTGYDELDGACAENAQTANNVVISPEVTAVTNGKASLTVQDTYFAMPNETPYLSFIFNLRKSLNNTADINENNLEIAWEGNQNVSPMQVFEEFEMDADAGEEELATYQGYTFTAKKKANESASGFTELAGKIFIPLNQLGENEDLLSGVVKIKYGNNLERKVTINVVPKYEFTITSIDETLTPINPYTDPIATVTFTIDNDYPEEMYPFNVLISSNDFAITNSEGVGLPIIYPGDGGYVESDEDDMGYKYVYQVTSPSVSTHTIKLISNHGDVVSVTDEGKIMLESKHFNAKSQNVSLKLLKITPAQSQYEFVTGETEFFNLGFNLKWLGRNKISINDLSAVLEYEGQNTENPEETVTTTIPLQPLTLNGYEDYQASTEESVFDTQGTVNVSLPALNEEEKNRLCYVVIKYKGVEQSRVSINIKK